MQALTLACCEELYWFAVTHEQKRNGDLWFGYAVRSDSIQRYNVVQI